MISTACTVGVFLRGSQHGAMRGDVREAALFAVRCTRRPRARRADGERVDWFPRVTYHQYLDTGISLAMYLAGKTIDRLPGDYVIERAFVEK